jgi:fumarate reductase subunit D
LDGAASRTARKVVYFLLDQAGATVAAIILTVAGLGTSLNTPFGGVQTGLR